jgi:RNA polymerase sigma-70 factor (ECF subfamily)
VSAAASDPDEDARLAGWMARIGRGDRQAFQSLYERLGGPVMGFLFRMSRERAVAEDLTQETFLRVWTHAARWTPRGRVTTWVFQIARRLWWKRQRRRQNRGRREAAWARAREARAGAPPAPGAALEQAEEVARIERALLLLSPRLRLVFVLLRLEGCSYAEAARIAGIRVGTAKSRMAAAEARLRNALAADDENPTP